jgi:CDP-6-deoxy-D-xylo-4-hexulose-3-dehydrase
MIELRRRNAELFLKLFKGDDHLVIQRENGRSSWFAFTFVLNPKLNIDREPLLKALKDADIGYRIITGGNFLSHDVIKYYDYDCVGRMENAETAHRRGFFVGNHPTDLTAQLRRLREVLDAAVR